MQSNNFFLRTSTNQFHSCQLLSSGQCMIKGCESRLINFDVLISILFSSLWLRDSTSSNWRMRKHDRRNIFVILFEVRFFVKEAKNLEKIKKKKVQFQSAVISEIFFQFVKSILENVEVLKLRFLLF